MLHGFWPRSCCLRLRQFRTGRETTPRNIVEADLVLRNPSSAGQRGLLEAGAWCQLSTDCCRSLSRRQDPVTSQQCRDKPGSPHEPFPVSLQAAAGRPQQPLPYFWSCGATRARQVVEEAMLWVEGRHAEPSGFCSSLMCEVCA